ncbi:YccS family putative transporter [Vibrio ostreicida]|uniref:YccS family putative transporter n=1 Tax=Vibrio ostreicida TaxID=526588 RepID=A0ABT8BX54_9VIBR|nr:YccS family putative transporter [Vibrio ostreicida]MDN3611583.1 YccS family putative transporter [Vibrio ostreicida]NPD09075.1 TIGR01666 family membrane protein [Vibrio ostreicida]
MSLISQLRLYWVNKTVNYSVLILVTLLGIVIPSWYYPMDVYIIPLILGVIAAALAESDDNFTGRLKAFIGTLICFATASFSIEFLFDAPLAFACGLFVSTFGFIMLGAVGPRYASIAFGSLLIAIYTMLGAPESTTLWQQPMLLLSGATWYFVASNLWSAMWPTQPVQQSLASVFSALADYLESKSELFHPTTNLQPQPHRIQEAMLNAKTVTALNLCKGTLVSRSRRGQIDSASDRYLNGYFLAQDIHERVSSSHYRYQELAQHFGHSDVLFRFKYLLETQAKACREVAQTIRLGRVYQYNQDSQMALEELRLSLSRIDNDNGQQHKSLLNQLNYLFNNLSTVEKQLSNISNPDAHRIEDGILDNTEARTLQAMWSRLTSHFNKDSMLFRHAVRMSIALTVGYAIIQLFEIEFGYWILLTTLFVCQPNYSATRQKLVARVMGTIAGLLIGTPLLTLFPSQESQLAIIVVSGVAFFALRLANYGYATGFITVLVLFCFHQLGDGYAVILPRLADTIIGCSLAVAAVAWIFPDWQAKRLHNVMAETIDASQQYLGQIIGQYRIGKKDSLSYRIARRHAHNQNANLANAISAMLAEPGRYRSAVDESFRFLTLNHALLSYISALGAHRKRINDPATHQLVLEAHSVIHGHLGALFHQLNHQNQPDSRGINPALDLETRLTDWRDEDENSVKMVLQQLYLIYRMMPELHSLASKFSARVDRS